MVRLYGILQYLGVCKDTENPTRELQEITKGLNFNLKKYKELKPLSSDGGIQVLRGFADAKTLASISKTNEEFQRPINKEHKRDIEEYLIKNTESAIYFPEVTLLYEYDPGVDPSDLAFRPLWEIEGIDKKDIIMLSVIDTLGLAYLDIQEDQTLYRLDGNHRLEVLGEASNGGLKRDIEKKKTKNNIFETNRNLSFCIILVPKTLESSYEQLYFYLLNAKGLPIDSIKTLDIVTKADERELKEFVENDPLLHILKNTKEAWGNFQNEEKEILMKVIKELLKNNDENKSLENIIKESIGIYRRMEDCKSSILGFICFLRLKCDDVIKTKEKLTYFQKWIEKFKYKIEHFEKISDLYEAFIGYIEEVSKTRYIFVAMEFNQDYIKTYESAITNIVNKIEGENDLLNFELMSIMNPDSDVNIPEKIFENIKKSHIVVVDISTNNTNVLFEYGYAKGLDKHIVLTYSKEWQGKVLQEFKEVGDNTPHLNKLRKDLEHKSFDIRTRNCQAWNDKNELEAILEKELKEYMKNMQ
ncbi:DNA sulfur modification protein DndB [Helicobacter pullorum]|uniref:DNA sulfur modification protein DndB n=1 Tax=Helicobacter pullorum TaxID=35818 RepID=UPI00255C3E8F|nr:DNA sulfur modification protein DndB [Helicobacter pullorum]